MGAHNESKKRDFISQMIALLEEEKAGMTEKGFDPTAKIEGLKTKRDTASQKEVAQQDAAAKAKEATKVSNEALTDAYIEASNLADLVSGLYGKEAEIVKKIRKFRK